MKLIALKETGKYGGGLVLVLPHDNRSVPAQPATPNAAHL